MTIRWAAAALDDVDRLADFAAGYDLALADAIEQELSQAPKRLLQFPRRGSRLSEFNPREIRELRVGKYLMRYELVARDISVLRIFHGRENRLSVRD